MQDIRPMLHIGDIMRIFSISQPTVYRWLREAKLGINCFPKALNGTSQKRKLLWNPADIERYIEAQSASQPQVNVHSPKQQRKEAKDVQQRQQRTSGALQRHGINVNLTKKGA